MKSKLCIMLVCVILVSVIMTDTVYCFDIDSAYGDYSANALVLGYKYFNKYDIKKTVTDLIKVKDKRDITIDTEHFSFKFKYYETEYETEKEREQSYKNVYLNIRDVDIKVRRQYDLEYKPWEYTEITTIGRSAFDLLPDDFRDYLASVDTMQSVFDSYSGYGFVYSDSVLEKEGFLQLCPQKLYNVSGWDWDWDWDWDSYYLKPYDVYYRELYQKRLADSGNRIWHVDDVMVPDWTIAGRTWPAYVVYMTDPNSIKIAYAEAWFYDVEPGEYNGLSKIIATLSYSEEADETGEKRLERIEFYTERVGNSEYYTSPPTGDNTVMLVAIMLASLTAVFKLQSRRIKKRI